MSQPYNPNDWDPKHNRYTRLMSLAAASMILLFLLLATLATPARSQPRNRLHHHPYVEYVEPGHIRVVHI